MLSLAQELARPIREHLRDIRYLVVGVSGGPDSQALLDLIASAREEIALARVWAVGIDHGLRPEAAHELNFAEALAERHTIPFLRQKVVVSRTGNLLANARSARYEALRKVSEELGAKMIAVGHTATDQAETVLHRLVRGTGLQGVGGMTFRQGDIVRPLLDVDRATLQQYLKNRGIAYAQDPSNERLDTTRVFIRKEILPRLEQLNPKATHALGQFASIARIDDACLATEARKLLARCQSPWAALNLQPLKKIDISLLQRVIRLWLEGLGLRIDFEAVNAVCQLLPHPGSKTTLGRIPITHEANHLIQEAIVPYRHALGTDVPLTLSKQDVVFEAIPLSVPEETTAASIIEETSTNFVAFDADKLHLPIEVRSRRDGDVFRPFGRDTEKKLNEVFTNAKVPRPLRNEWPLVTAGSKIIWVAGLKRSAHAPVVENTSCVLKLKMTGNLRWWTDRTQPVCPGDEAGRNDEEMK